MVSDGVFEHRDKGLTWSLTILRFDSEQIDQ